MCEKVEVPFKSKTFQNSSRQLTIRNIAYFVHQSIWGPFRPKVGIMAHLVMSDLLIYPFCFKEPVTLREILDLIKRGHPLYLLFVQPYILRSPNSKGQIKY